MPAVSGFAPSVPLYVRWGLLGDRAILLNLRTNVYIGLEGIAALMWKAVADREEPRATMAHVVSRFQAPVEQVARDYEEFLRSLLEKGLLVYSLPIVRASRLQRECRTAKLSLLPAWVSMLRIRWRLRKGGLAFAYVYAEACPTGSPQRDDNELESALEAFKNAENLLLNHRASGDCLSRSLSLFVFLRRAGFSVIHKIGVANAPFRAHAWVEAGGQPLFEEAERIARFTVLASLP